MNTIKEQTAYLKEAYNVTVKRISGLNPHYQIIGDEGVCGTVEISSKRYSKQGFTGKSYIVNGKPFSNILTAVESGILGF